MSWMSKLCETYDNNAANVYAATSTDDLLPIAHTTQYAQLEITLNADGEFLEARVLEKEEGMTIIPVTEDSAARTSGLEPHPLFDKLQYIAGDYKELTNTKKESDFENYYAKLTKWVNSPYSHEMVKSIHAYLGKKKLISDLITCGIFYTDANGKVIDKWTGDGEKPKIFTLTSEPSDFFVRFCVEIPGVPDSRVWMNETVRKKFVEYYLQSFSETNLCYVTGKPLPPSRKSPGKIRHVGDAAKLISSNDTSGFTFRGRAETAEQAVTLSYESAQKSINALKWLIKKQAYRNEDQAIVSWGTKNEKIPEIITDADLFFGDLPVSEKTADTKAEYAHRLNKKIAGYAANLEPDSSIVVMGLDSTNGTKGRLSITYYRELAGSDFLNRIEHWHKTCSWYPLHYTRYDENNKSRHIRFYGAPSPADIAFAAFGSRLDEKLKKATVERLLPCIIDGTPLPKDIIHSLIGRASRPVSMETWEWNKTVGIACAVIRKYYNDLKNKRTDLKNYTEVWTVELNETENDRSYLFGRLLAYARRIEEYALYVGKAEPRQTNAERFMTPFKKHPMKTWDELYLKLMPYMSRFRNMSPGSLGNRYEAEMNAVISQLKNVPNAFSNESLSPLYLLGYQSQMNQFNKEIQEMKERKIEDENKGE